MKKVIKLLLLAVCCGILILVCINVRNNKKPDTIKAEIISRIKILSEKTEAITMAELTPFVWTEEYIYGGYSSPERFQTFMGGKQAEYMDTQEFNHRGMFFAGKKLVFDTRVVDSYYDWYMIPIGDYILTPSDWLNIDLTDNGIDLYVVKYNKEK